jgi:hypothetical protein
MSLMFPKPEKPERDRKYMGLVAQLPCVIPSCQGSPVQVHHVIMDRFSQSKSGDRQTIPLCYWHHHTLHMQTAWWRETYGPDHGFLPAVEAQLKDMRERSV